MNTINAENSIVKKVARHSHITLSMAIDRVKECRQALLECFDLPTEGVEIVQDYLGIDVDLTEII